MTILESRRESPGARPPRSAFTLLELLLVLGIIVLMVGLAWPALRGSLAKNRLRDSAQLLRVELARARLTAMEQGTPLEFRYRAGEGKFRIAARQVASELPMGAAPPPAQGSYSAAAPDDELQPSVTEAELPEGVVFAELAASLPASERPYEGSSEEDFDSDPEDESLRSEGWSSAIIFLPDGTATNATLALRNGKGAQVLVQLRGLTGLAKPGDVESCSETESPAENVEAPVKTARDDAGLVR